MSDMTAPRMEIDPLRLDREWQMHPQEYYNWAKAAADAAAAYEQAKSALEVVRAEVDSDVRQDPAAYGLVKTTEDAIKAAIASHGAYTAARQKMLKALHEKDLAEAVVDALDHRRRALDALTQLYIRDYYSQDGPKPVPNETREEYETRAVRSRGRDRLARQALGEDDADG